MKVYTVRNGTVVRGAKVGTLKLKSEVEIPILSVGEEGKKKSVIPIKLLPESFTSWKAGNEIEIVSCDIGKTRNSSCKLVERKGLFEGKALCVFLTDTGYKGGNNHTGDRMNSGKKYLPFPGKILVEETIAEGSGSQIIAVIDEKTVFRTSYSGKLYGKSSCHYYYWDGNNLHGGFTWETRKVQNEW